MGPDITAKTGGIPRKLRPQPGRITARHADSVVYGWIGNQARAQSPHLSSSPNQGSRSPARGSRWTQLQHHASVRPLAQQVVRVSSRRPAL